MDGKFVCGRFIPAHSFDCKRDHLPRWSVGQESSLSFGFTMGSDLSKRSLGPTIACNSNKLVMMKPKPKSTDSRQAKLANANLHFRDRSTLTFCEFHRSLLGTEEVKLYFFLYTYDYCIDFRHADCNSTKWSHCALDYNKNTAFAGTRSPSRPF